MKWVDWSAHQRSGGLAEMCVALNTQLLAVAAGERGGQTGRKGRKVQVAL